jgi:predicted transcriptional regulator
LATDRIYAKEETGILAFRIPIRYRFSVTDKQAVFDLLRTLPEHTSLKEIIEELRILASIRRGRADVAAGRSKNHGEVEQSVKSWTAARG